MASQVLSGASNPSYVNNTGENVRVVINYMRSSIEQVAARLGGNLGVFSENDVFTYDFTLQMSWAGVSLTTTSRLIYQVGGRTSPIPAFPSGPRIIQRGGPVTIGRNIAFAGQQGANSNVPLGGQNYAQEIANSVQRRGDTPVEPGVPSQLTFDGGRESPSEEVNTISAEELVTGTDVRVFPTEIILAPGQTFSAICGIHNIVIIPENG